MFKISNNVKLIYFWKLYFYFAKFTGDYTIDCEEYLN